MISVENRDLLRLSRLPSGQQSSPSGVNTGTFGFQRRLGLPTIQVPSIHGLAAK